MYREFPGETSLEKSISKVLIANRGEIALRIQRACHKLGKSTVSICSEADTDALFAKKADQLVVIGPPPAAESYLHIEKIVQAAKETGCDAVHPGYGFLSENADFARWVTESGLTFIGPTAESISILGSKTEARKLAMKAGIPLPQGVDGGLDDETIVEKAQQIGFPVMIKAVAGGGGRGMRFVESATELRDQLPRARAEAKKFFSNDDVYIERRIIEPRHVEVQVLGDAYGNVIHLGTRDCSTQRRNQKLVEEAPAPDLDNELREQIHTAAVKLARAANYQNAGTVEFLVKNKEFFFLEMNTRIQVEHPVTEEVTGVDLVELQIRVAQREELPLRQNQVTFSGHAIEYRIYAEDPNNNFMPSLGTITKQSYPENDYLRLDNGFEVGSPVTPYYDAMLSKVIVVGASRNEAVTRSLDILREIEISGIEDNIGFHTWLLERTPFASTPLEISYLEKNFKEETLKEYELSKLIDPKHASYGDSYEKVEHFKFATSDQNVFVTVELTHLKDGTFLAAPVNDKGQYAQEEFCRRSNGYETVLNALQAEVLQNYSLYEMFLPRAS